MQSEVMKMKELKGMKSQKGVERFCRF